MSSLLLDQRDIVAREEPQSTSQAGEKDLWKSMEYSHVYLQSFTIVVLDEKDIECEISCRPQALPRRAGMAELADAGDSKSSKKLSSHHI
jgi:hypothetical protein